MALAPTFQEEAVPVILAFLRHHLRESGAQGFLVNLSGGLDSSVTVKLCAEAAGAERTMALLQPDELARPEDVERTRTWVDALGVTWERLDIGPLVQGFVDALDLPASPPHVVGNVRARVRMVVAYAVANRTNRLVIGTGNKSEILTGYFTKFGDGGCDLLPIGDLYKTQVRDLARHLGLPEAVVERTPTAGLWEGQTDEDELGMSYDVLDGVLLGLELQLPPEVVAERTGQPMERVRHVEGLVRRSIHKRKMPLIPKLGIRTVGLDWRE